MTQSDADFLRHIRTKYDMLDSNERGLLLGIVKKMQLQSICSWVEPEKADRVTRATARL